MMTRVRPPGPRPWPVIGIPPAFLRHPAAYLQKIAAKYGDVVRLQVSGDDIYLLSHPDFVRDVLIGRRNHFVGVLPRAQSVLGLGLLTSEGDLHKRHRRMIQPAFRHDRIAGYCEAIVSCVWEWRDRFSPGTATDIDREMTHMAVATVGRALFGGDVHAEVENIATALSQVYDIFGLHLLPGVKWISRLPLPAVRRFHQGRKYLDEMIYGLIGQRRANPRDTGDVLSTLLLGRDEEGAGMSDELVRDHAMTLFLTGYETVANAISWCWYLLSENPAVEARFHEEIETVLGSRRPAFEDIPKLRYTEHAFAEAMRLYPSVWMVGRRALTNFEVGPYGLAPKSVVMLNFLGMHRDSRWFPEPERFLPERWDADPGYSNPAYMPFGAGPRQCAGERFAWVEGVLALAIMGQKWRFRMCPGQSVETEPRFTLRPKNGLKMMVEKR